MGIYGKHNSEEKKSFVNKILFCICKRCVDTKLCQFTKKSYVIKVILHIETGGRGDLIKNKTKKDFLL